MWNGLLVARIYSGPKRDLEFDLGSEQKSP